MSCQSDVLMTPTELAEGQNLRAVALAGCVEIPFLNVSNIRVTFAKGTLHAADKNEADTSWTELISAELGLPLADLSAEMIWAEECFKFNEM